MRGCCDWGGRGAIAMLGALPSKKAESVDGGEREGGVLSAQ